MVVGSWSLVLLGVGWQGLGNYLAANYDKRQPTTDKRQWTNSAQLSEICAGETSGRCLICSPGMVVVAPVAFLGQEEAGVPWNPNKKK